MKVSRTQPPIFQEFYGYNLLNTFDSKETLQIEIAVVQLTNHIYRYLVYCSSQFRTFGKTADITASIGFERQKPKMNLDVSIAYENLHRHIHCYIY